MQCIGVVQPWRTSSRGQEKLLEQGEDLGVQIHAVVAGLGPARPQMTGEIPPSEPQLQDPARLCGQPLGDALLMGQAEVFRLAQAHGGLHHAVHFQPAVAGIFQDGEAAFGFGAEVQ
ncbi:hypothetical protein D3C72_1836120 [compost metagenome]